jgi:hypothetical protein
MIKIDIKPNELSKGKYEQEILFISNEGHTPCRDLYIEFATSRELFITKGGRAIRKNFLMPNQNEERELTVIAKESGIFWFQSNPSSHYWNFEGIQKLAFSIPVKVTETPVIESTNKEPVAVGFRHSEIIKLCSLIEARFSLNELSDLCFRLEIDFENLGGTTKKNQSLELVKYCQRHNKLEQLIEQCLELRPYADWIL